MNGKHRILIVEDEDSTRLSLRDFLAKKDYDVTVASDGVGAIKQMLDFDVDMIITDYRMKLLGGDYWLRFLEKFYSDKIIIITSGFLNPEYKVPFPIVYKPFEYEKLEEMIRTLLADK